MGQEVPQVKTGPLANALNSIRDPSCVDNNPKNSINKSATAARGGRGGGRAGRGKAGGRGSAYSSAASSRAGSRASSMTSGTPCSDEESGDEAAGAAAAADDEAVAVNRWMRAPQSALERAAGELAACGVAVGCR
jgi:hypothetical protein